MGDYCFLYEDLLHNLLMNTELVLVYFMTKSQREPTWLKNTFKSDKSQLGRELNYLLLNITHRVR